MSPITVGYTSTTGLFLMLDSVICILNLETLEISKQEELNTMGTMFEAHSYEADYILYGEMEIYRISSELKVVWQFSARDIFVRYQGEEPAFEMKQDRICLITTNLFFRYVAYRNQKPNFYIYAPESA